MGEERGVFKSLKAGVLVYWVSLLTLIVLFLSTTSLATEYKVVKAEEILKQMENGEDVNLTNCHIVGELDVSKIKLKTVSNPYFYKILNEGVDKDILISEGCNENVSVVDSNIKIKNSVFENSLYFSNVLFENSTNFGGTIFNDSVNFSGGNFKNYAGFENTNFNSTAEFKVVNYNSTTNFSKAKFNNPAYFKGANFNSIANFNFANFSDTANFFGATFNNPAFFSWVNFNRTAHFSWTDFNNGIADFTHADFNGPTYFGWANFNTSKAVFLGANFNDAAYFERAKFNSTANFFDATFNGISDFKLANFNDTTDFSNAIFNHPSNFSGLSKSENIITDARNSKIFIKYYDDEARHIDADNIYYNYRKKAQEDKHLTDVSKWKDILSWVLWGYGTKPIYTIYTAVFLIIVFSIIYKNPGLSLINEEGKKTSIRLYWRKPGIYRKNETKESMVSSWEILYFGINIFTKLGPANWEQRDSFRKWVILEGFLGWITLAIFMATFLRRVW